MTTNSRIPRPRGRPPKDHDNRRVRAFISTFATYTQLAVAFPSIEDVITGASHLQTTGQASSRPLSRGLIFRVLSACVRITTEAVEDGLGRDYKPATVWRYMAASIVASKAIEGLLKVNPSWAARAVQHPLAVAEVAAAMRDVDAPFFAELAALGFLETAGLNLPYVVDDPEVPASDGL